MNRRILIASAAIACIVMATVSVRAQTVSGVAPVLPAYSPFESLQGPPVAKKLKLQFGTHFMCGVRRYYDDNGTPMTHTDNVPTPLWAARVTPMQTAVSVCTVWTIWSDFELLNADLVDKDTIQIVIKEVFAPYAVIFTTYYIARPGDNIGEVEIDPPAAPPYNWRPIIAAPLRDFYVGYYIRGKTTHQVTYRFMTPELYSSPYRSVKFASPSATSFVTASSVLGQGVEWKFEAKLCCDTYIPVELATFSGVLRDGGVDLQWRTESETNNHGFEVQRAASNRGPWTTIGFVPGNGSSTQASWYSFRDNDALRAAAEDAGALWYRLRQVDYNGAIDEHPPIQVQLITANNLRTALSPVFPNPFQASVQDAVVIPYSLRQDGPVAITVHDALGREVATVLDGTQAAGFHEALWHPQWMERRLSGRYYIHLQAGTVSAVVPVTVIE